VTLVNISKVISLMQLPKVFPAGLGLRSPGSVARLRTGAGLRLSQRLFAPRRASSLVQTHLIGVDQCCHAIVACNLRQKQLRQDEQLAWRCRHWVPTWQKDVVCVPAAG